VRCSGVWVGIDRCCLVRVDAESDGGCTGPSDRSVSRSARDCPGHIGPQLVTLYASLPARAAVVSFTGHSDPRRVASLNAREVAFESAIKSGKKAEEIDLSEWWTASDGRALEEEVEMAMRGLLFLGIK
jgi:hypothetical protein